MKWAQHWQLLSPEGTLGVGDPQAQDVQMAGPRPVQQMQTETPQQHVGWQDREGAWQDVDIT